MLHGDAQYFGHVKEIKNGEVRVLLGDKLNNDGDPGDPIDRLDKSVWLKPDNISSRSQASCSDPR